MTQFCSPLVITTLSHLPVWVVVVMWALKKKEVKRGERGAVRRV